MGEKLFEGLDDFALPFKVPNPGISFHPDRSQYYGVKLLLQKVFDQNSCKFEKLLLFLEWEYLAGRLLDCVEGFKGVEVEIGVDIFFHELLVAVESSDKSFQGARA